MGRQGAVCVCVRVFQCSHGQSFQVEKEIHALGQRRVTMEAELATYSDLESLKAEAQAQVRRASMAW